MTLDYNEAKRKVHEIEKDINDFYDNNENIEVLTSKQEALKLTRDLTHLLEEIQTVLKGEKEVESEEIIEFRVLESSFANRKLALSESALNRILHINIEDKINKLLEEDNDTSQSEVPEEKEYKAFQKDAGFKRANYLNDFYIQKFKELDTDEAWEKLDAPSSPIVNIENKTEKASPKTEEEELYDALTTNFIETPEESFNSTEQAIKEINKLLEEQNSD